MNLPVAIKNILNERMDTLMVIIESKILYPINDIHPHKHKYTTSKTKNQK